MTDNQNKKLVDNTQKPGCGMILVFVLVSIWIVVMNSVDLFTNWVLEQTMYESTIGVTDIRWINHATFSGLIFVVCLITALTVKQPRMKRAFRLWLSAAILSVLSIPIKTLFITDQNMTAVFQIAILLVVISFNLILNRKQAPANGNVLEHAVFPGLTILLGAVICVPWVLWGALGSVVDALLEILVGVFFAWMSVSFIFRQYLEPTQHPEGEFRFRDVLFDGFVVAIFLLTTVTALSANGSQQMLLVTVPIAGWLVAVVSLTARNKQGHGRLSAAILLGLLFALPLLFFDMDELSASILGSGGEVLEWANKAAWYTFSAILTITVILIPNRRNAGQVKLPGRWNLYLSLTGVLGIIVVYLIWGQVGFFGDHQLIILKTQADLSEQQQIKDYSSKRTAVYQELVKTAETSQSDLRARLDRMNLHYTSYYLLNAIEVDGGTLIQLLLQKDPSVDRILDNPELRPLPKITVLEEGENLDLPQDTLWNLSMIQADRVVEELHIDGSGIVIGQTDSGVDGRHPELAETYRGANSVDDYNWYDPWNNTPFPTDVGGHGTLTLGIILGEHTGVAPGAHWIGCANLARNLGSPSVYLDCMQFMLAPFPQGGDPFTDGDPSKGAMIVNNSWGCPSIEGCDVEVFQTTVAALKEAGIFMSVSAGNTGYYGCSTVSDPLAIYADVFTVGSVNLAGNISDFSSVGPVIIDGSERMKPDLVAPGENITSSYPNGTYSSASGTSLSAPHVSGVVALMWSANPKLIGNIEATSAILRDTAQPYHGIEPACGKEEAAGSGILDAYAAVQAAITYNQ